MDIVGFPHCCGAIVIIDFPKQVDEKSTNQVRQTLQLWVPARKDKQIHVVLAKSTSESKITMLKSVLWPYYNQLGFGPLLEEFGFVKTSSWVNNPGLAGEATNEHYVYTPKGE